MLNTFDAVAAAVSCAPESFESVGSLLSDKVEMLLMWPACKKRNRSHTQTHDKNNTTQHTTRTPPRVNPG